MTVRASRMCGCGKRSRNLEKTFFLGDNRFVATIDELLQSFPLEIRFDRRRGSARRWYARDSRIVHEADTQLVGAKIMDDSVVDGADRRRPCLSDSVLVLLGRGLFKFRVELSRRNHEHFDRSVMAEVIAASRAIGRSVKAPMYTASVEHSTTSNTAMSTKILFLTSIGLDERIFMRPIIQLSD